MHPGKVFDAIVASIVADYIRNHHDSHQMEYELCQIEPSIRLKGWDTAYEMHGFCTMNLYFHITSPNTRWLSYTGIKDHREYSVRVDLTKIMNNVRLDIDGVL